MPDGNEKYKPTITELVGSVPSDGVSRDSIKSQKVLVGRAVTDITEEKVAQTQDNSRQES